MSCEEVRYSEGGFYLAHTRVDVILRLGGDVQGFGNGVHAAPILLLLEVHVDIPDIETFRCKEERYAVCQCVVRPGLEERPPQLRELGTRRRSDLKGFDELGANEARNQRRQNDSDGERETQTPPACCDRRPRKRRLKVWDLSFTSPEPVNVAAAREVDDDRVVGAFLLVIPFQSFPKTRCLD